MADDPSSPMPDMGSLLGMAMEMQQQMLAAQEQAAQTVVEGQSGGGVVRIEVTGGLEFRSVRIDPDAVDPDDVEMLQDLVLAALNDAVAQVNELAQAGNPMASLDLSAVGLGGDGIDGLDIGAELGDMNLGALSGMLGLGEPVVSEVAEPAGDQGDQVDDDDDDDEGGEGVAERNG